MAGLKCLQLRYQITWLIWDNFIGSQWNASKCLPLFINLVPRGRDPFARSGWQSNADSGNEIDSSSIEDNRNERSQRNLSNLLCREYIIWESREKSSDEICFTDIGVTIFFFILQEHIITWSTADARMVVRTVRNPAVGADFAGVWHFLIQIM